MDQTALQCCFTGHRPQKLNMSEYKIRPLLRRAIEDSVEDGLTTFITGMACGIDIWAAEEVLSIRKFAPSVRLICAVPYPSFRNSRSASEKQIYDRIMSNADFTHIVSEDYSMSCYQRRNIWMVDNSSRVIAAYNGTKGGTKNTIDYAISKGIDIVNIFK